MFYIDSSYFANRLFFCERVLKMPFYLFAIELDDDQLSNAQQEEFRDRNPDGVAGKPFVVIRWFARTAKAEQVAAFRWSIQLPEQLSVVLPDWGSPAFRKSCGDRLPSRPSRHW